MKQKLSLFGISLLFSFAGLSQTAQAEKDISADKALAGDIAEEICNDIYYDRITEEKHCLALPAEDIEKLAQVYHYLEYPFKYDWELEIDPEALSVFGSGSFKNLVEDYSIPMARKAMEWIALSEPIASALKNNDYNYGLMNELLKRSVLPSINDEHPVFSAVTNPLNSQGESFMDIAVDSDNPAALQWIHGYLFNEEIDGLERFNLTNSLRAHCKIAQSLKPKTQVGMWDFDFFDEYINNIIALKINEPGWSNSDFDTADEVDNIWRQALCNGIEGRVVSNSNISGA